MDYGCGKGNMEEARAALIKGFGAPASVHSFEKDGKKITVAQYYREVYKITLKFPNLFTILVKGKFKDMVNIPAECCRICPNQIVRTEQLINNEQAELIKVST